MKRKPDLSFSQALAALQGLIEQTREVLDKVKARGDAAGFAKLAFQQRHNLKVLLRQIERAKK